MACDAGYEQGVRHSIDSSSFYATYHGHDVDLLSIAHDALRMKHRSIIFLAGDSSVDNKYWIRRWAQAVNGYEEILFPPTMKTDVCYWLNSEAVRRGQPNVCCLNTAVEATSLSDRACCCLLAQDRFIRRNITSHDYLVVSVGGNDIALKPLVCTVFNMLVLTRCVPMACIESCSCGCPPIAPPSTCVDFGCPCCGLLGCVTGMMAWPPGLGYFLDLFGNLVQSYVWRLIGCRQPKKVLICMIYYPDELATGSWADAALGALGYDGNPAKLQAAIRTIFRLATSRICIPSVDVVAFPFFEVLDGKISDDYVARVEPSASGGKKLAVAMFDRLLESGSSESDEAEAPPMQGMT
eukprot:TRINITY_DN75101_c0_g1_i1.p1 TRINITY_DN75101_c0_g1~~TRINITY_DN75101_c0_g1_i1.p1  ORF type:complete len:372 (-),score=55.50 TRINITY_DN75101_c0_g1_i1:292-1347(-)